MSQTIDTAVARMRAWASAHPEADTQELTDEQWQALAQAALGLPSTADGDDELVMLHIPCSVKVLPKLRAGLPVFSIRLDDQGDGTHSLSVHGINGPLSDPFADPESTR